MAGSSHDYGCTIRFDQSTAICATGDCPPKTTLPIKSGACLAPVTNSSIQLSTGQLLQAVSLLATSAISSVGAWAISLINLSNSGYKGVLGENWSYTQNTRLCENPDGSIELLTSDFTHQRYELDETTGKYISTCTEPSFDDKCVNNTMSVLERFDKDTPEDTFIHIGVDGTQTTFSGFDESISTPGRPKSITSPEGNSQYLDWAYMQGQIVLVKVTDDYGRTTTYNYVCKCTEIFLESVTDFAGQTVKFQLSDDNQLDAIIMPAVTEGADGNTFPGGTAIAFARNSKSRRPELRNNIIATYSPIQVQPYLDPETRTVDMAGLLSGNCCKKIITTQESESCLCPPVPVQIITFNEDATDLDHYSKVIQITDGNPSDGVGGTTTAIYTTMDLPINLIDPSDPITHRSIVTDPNGNQTVYDMTAAGMAARVEQIATRGKNNLEADRFVTWTKFNANNQPLEVVHPEGNTDEYEYESGDVVGFSLYPRRRGFLLRVTRKPGNSLGLPSRSGSSGQTELTTRYFYDPLFGHLCASIDACGNPIDGSGTYFTPQNGGTTPTNTDRSRYATFRYFDYQKDTLDTVKNDPALHALFFPGLDATTAAAKIAALIAHVNQQMIDGGLPNGFQMALGDINGDGTGDGDGSGGSTPVPGTLPTKHLGRLVKVQHPSVRQLVENPGAGDPWVWDTQDRVELFTVNHRGQRTTYTDPEGNVTATVRYPYADPDGNGIDVIQGLGNKQYGHVREVHVDVDPFDVMSLIGEDGDLVDFISDVYPRNARTNTPGIYQNLVTRYEGGSSGGGCSTCAYDSFGNPLAMTDPRGFTWRYQRNELGEVYRTIAPQPYGYMVETYYDANRRVIRVDTQDMGVQFISDDPTNAGYAKFTPSVNDFTANQPVKSGPGGSVRPGWFTNLYTYDVLNNKIEEDIDATGSSPSSLVSKYEYDANLNLIKVTKPERNIVEYDYDERNLRIATRVGYAPSANQPGAVTISVYDKNGNLKSAIGPAQRGGAGNSLTAVIADAFSSGQSLTHTGDWSVENTYDGFDRVIKTTDAVGNVGEASHDPNSRVIASVAKGPVGGSTPGNRNGTNNVILASGAARFDEAGRTYESQQNVFVGLNTQLVRTITAIGGGLEANATTNGHTASNALTDGSFKGLGPITGSYVLSRSVFDRAGRMTLSAQDNAATSTYVYDGASRAIRVTDALGNQIDSTHDANGNVVQTRSTQKCTITTPTVADEIFESASWYDCLNRPLISAVQGADGVLDLNPLDSAPLGGDSSTLFAFNGYDSRGNTVTVTDAKGNTALTVYDGAGRAYRSVQHLRKDGQGSNGASPSQTMLPDGGSSIVTTSVYDGNSRVTQLIDDRGAVTAYTYDTLDRQLTMVFNDGATRTSVYNLASNVITYTDENGSVFNSTFDPLGRKTSVAITPAPGVDGTTAQSFQYDGLSRLTFSRDTAEGVDADATFSFDSLGRVVEESQTYLGNTRTVTHEEWTSLVATGFTFPQGRQLDNTFDALYRRTDVAEAGGASIATWDFFGPSRVAEVELGNGLICTFMNNARTHSAVQSSVPNPAWGDDSSDRLGYDGSGRMITKRFLAGGINGGTGAYNDPTSVIGFTTSFDLASNKLYERHLHAENRSHLYEPFENGIPQGGYDSLDRLRQYQRGTLSTSGGGGGSIATAITLPNTDESRTYDLDGLGNWKKTNYTPVGDVNTTEQRQHNKLNQITRTKVDATLTGFTYDKSGNLLNDGIRLYEYDALNRLLKVYKDPNGTPAIIGTYNYDAGGRRIRKVVSNDGLTGTIPNSTTDCLYTGWRCIEERDGSNNPTKQMVWGIYIDELIQQKNITAINNFVANTQLYPLQDLLYRTTGLADNSGIIREAYDCDAYGNTLIFRNAGSPPAQVDYDDSDTQVDYPTCEFLYTGQRWDAESTLCYCKKRYLSSFTGRFVSRDPLYYSEGLNLYAAYFSMRIELDPYGTQSSPYPPTRPTAPVPPPKGGKGGNMGIPGFSIEEDKAAAYDLTIVHPDAWGLTGVSSIIVEGLTCICDNKSQASTGLGWRFADGPRIRPKAGKIAQKLYVRTVFAVVNAAGQQAFYQRSPEAINRTHKHEDKHVASVEAEFRLFKGYWWDNWDKQLKHLRFHDETNCNEQAMVMKWDIEHDWRNVVAREAAHANDGSPLASDAHSPMDEILGKDGWDKSAPITIDRFFGIYNSAAERKMFRQPLPWGNDPRAK